MSSQIRCSKCNWLVNAGRYCQNCQFPLPIPAYTSGQVSTASYQRSQPTSGLHHARYLATCHRLYGIFSALVTLFSAVLAVLGVFISSLIPALLKTILGHALFEKLFGSQSSNWMISTIVYVGRFGPIVLAIFSVLVTLLIGLAFTAPFFATASGLKRGRRWTKIAGVIAILLSIEFFPLGTALSLYTLWYLFIGAGRNTLTR